MPLEAVSGVLATNSDWDRQISTFWEAQLVIFHEPDRSTKAGTHVHITPGPSRKWTVSQLRRIAVGIIRYENLVQEMLPYHRRTLRSSVRPGCLQSPIDATDHNYYHYARSNSSSRSDSRENLNDMFNQGGSSSKHSRLFDNDDLVARLQRLSFAGPTQPPREKSHAQLLEEIQRRSPRMNEEQIVQWMQGDNRYVLWNFQNIRRGGSGTIEFRGGRGMRGPNRTKWVIGFVVGFIHLLLVEVRLGRRRALRFHR